jgi:hypothetical protein
LLHEKTTTLSQTWKRSLIELLETQCIHIGIVSYGYSQIAMVVDDKWKTTFIAEWSPYHFEGMSFGAMNAQMTF